MDCGDSASRYALLPADRRADEAAGRNLKKLPMLQLEVQPLARKKAGKNIGDEVSEAALAPREPGGGTNMIIVARRIPAKGVAGDERHRSTITGDS
jgi:hypothetical protein